MSNVFQGAQSRTHDQLCSWQMEEFKAYFMTETVIDIVQYWLCTHLLFLLNKLNFYHSFTFTEKIKKTVYHRKSSHIPHTQFPLLSTTYVSMVYWLQLIDQYGYISIIKFHISFRFHQFSLMASSVPGSHIGWHIIFSHFVSFSSSHICFTKLSQRSSSTVPTVHYSAASILGLLDPCTTKSLTRNAFFPMLTLKGQKITGTNNILTLKNPQHQCRCCIHISPSLYKDLVRDLVHEAF